MELHLFCFFLILTPVVPNGDFTGNIIVLTWIDRVIILFFVLGLTSVVPNGDVHACTGKGISQYQYSFS